MDNVSILSIEAMFPNNNGELNFIDECDDIFELKGRRGGHINNEIK